MMNNQTTITMTKSFAIFLLVLGLLIAVPRGITRVIMTYEYTNKVECNWDLSVRASTIAQKSEYMDKFVSAIEKCNLEGTNSSLLLQTPETDFNENFKALKSLQKRLKDISGLDENSFAYQTALQQITAQEQGEAGAMLRHIQSCWNRQNYYSFWNWIYVVGFVLLEGIPMIVGIYNLLDDSF